MKLYFKDSMHALIAHKFHNIKAICYPTPEQIGEYGSSDPWPWLHTCREDGYCEVYMAEDCLDAFLNIFGNRKIYVHPEDVEKLLQAELGDFVSVWDGYHYDGYVIETAEDLEKFNSCAGDKEILQRDMVSFPEFFIEN